jgi:hypothetical protein
MRLIQVVSRCTRLLTLALLVPMLWASMAEAQEPDRIVYSRKYSSFAEVRAALDEALMRGASAAEIDAIALEMDLFMDERGAMGRQLARSASALDRAFGYVWTADLETRFHNFNNIGRDGISCEYFPSPNTDNRDRLNYMITLAVGVPEGPWGPNAQVHEQSEYINSLSLGDWEAKDDSRGTLFADPPQTRFDYPLLAITTLEATWPESGWPAPESEVTTWYESVTWNKWQRKGDMETYGEFTDAYSGRDDAGESYPLGIDVRFRLLQYGAMPATFYQFELENTSSHTFTDVYLCWHHYRYFGSIAGYTSAGFPRWNDEYNLLYGVGKRYDPVTGIHYVSTSTSNDRLSVFGGFVFLQSPTGSFRTDAAGDTTDQPSQVLTRLAMVNSSDRIVQADHEWGFYGALSGDPSYFDDPATLDNIWKYTTQGGGSPILFQTEANYKYYRHGPYTVPPEDPWNPDQSTIDGVSANGWMYPSSGPFTWAPGDKVDFIVAEVIGNTEFELLANAEKVVKSYQNQMSWSGPPDTPRLKTNGVLAGRDHRVYDSHFHPYPTYYAPSGPITLFWDGTASESAIDAITGNLDFQGYRIYKSDDRGRTWGEPITDENGSTVGRVAAVTFDLVDGISGKDPTGEKSLGNDSGLQHEWTDENVIDGFEYWYAITAFDYDPAQDPNAYSFESSVGADPTTPNVISVIAGSRPAGYMSGMIGSGTAAADTATVYLPAEPERETGIFIEVVDDNAITGHDYSITIADHAVYGYAEFDYLGGLMVRDETLGVDMFTAPVLGSRPEYGFDNIPVVDGFRILTVDPVDGSGVPVTDGGVYEFEQTTDVDPTAAFTVSMEQAYMEAAGSAANRANHTGLMNDIELRFTGWGSTVCLGTAGGGNAVGTPIDAPFEVWDVGTNTRLMPLCYWPGQATWDGDYTLITPIPYFQADGVTVTDVQALHPTTDSDYWSYDTSDPNSRSDWAYRVRFNERSAATVDDYWDPGDVWTLTPYKLLKGLAGQTFNFETTEATSVEAEADLDLIKAVPNPYFIFARWDRDENARKIEFTNVPPNSTVDIYTISGELVASLLHDGTYHSDKVGSVYWKLWTFEYTEAAYGLYIFVVKTDDGRTKIGKFAIIR